MLLLLREYASTYIHLFPSPELHKNILLLIRERIAKNISVFLCEINAQVILVTTTCYIISKDECSKKREKKKIRGNKKGQVPGTSKENKNETRGKNGQVSDTRIRGTRYPPERKEKENIGDLILLKKFQKSKKGMYPLKRAQVELDFHHYFHHYHHLFATHAHLDLTY